MLRLVNTLALAAALVVLAVSLWQDWSLLATLKRMAVGYLGFYFLGAVAGVAVKLAGALEKDHPGGSKEAGAAASRDM